MPSPPDASGFSLIELLVTLAIVASVLVTAVPLGLGWVNRAKATEAGAQFQSLIIRAKAAAIQNAAGARDDSGVSATVCQSGTNIYIHSGTTTSCGTSPLWTMAIPGGSNTSIQLAGASFACLLLNNVGLPVSGSISTTTCTTVSAYPVSYSVTTGGESVSSTLF